MNAHIKRSSFVLVLLALFGLSSCVYTDLAPVDPNSAELEVQVYGALSGAPREGIRVSLHLTEHDARNNINPVTGYVWTDYDGFVYFYGLPPNEQFFIRAKALLVRSVRSTDRLGIGYNFQAVPIL